MAEDASESVQYVFLVSQITFAERFHLCIEHVSIANTSLSPFRGAERDLLLSTLRDF